MAAADTVARQVDAYNAHDLEAFLACYTDDVVVTSGNGDVLLEGAEAVREQYGVMFERLPDVQVAVRHRIELGAWVVDDEHVTADRGLRDRGAGRLPRARRPHRPRRRDDRRARGVAAGYWWPATAWGT